MKTIIVLKDLKMDCGLKRTSILPMLNLLSLMVTIEVELV